MTKISVLPPDAAPTNTDYIVVVDSESGQTKKVLLSSLFSQLLIGTTGLADEAVTAAKIANRTRSINMLFFAEGSGGAVSSAVGGMPEVAFTGTPTGFLRTQTIIPADYVSGTDVVIRLKTYATNGATHTARRYLNTDAVGEAINLWDVDNNVQSTGHVYAATTAKDIDITVAAATIAVDTLVSMAWRIETAITGTVYVDNVSLRYTADS